MSNDNHRILADMEMKIDFLRSEISRQKTKIQDEQEYLERLILNVQSIKGSINKRIEILSQMKVALSNKTNEAVDFYRKVLNQ